MWFKASILLIILTTQESKAEWICKDASIFRKQSQVISCGIGENPKESLARDAANKNAYKMFFDFCRNSDDCRSQKVLIYPRRNECMDTLDGYKCYHAIDFYITPEQRQTVLLDYSRLQEEIESRKSTLVEIREQQSQLREISSLEEEIKFASPAVSYWDLALGVSIRGDSVSRSERLSKTEYNLRMGYCFYSKVCTGFEVGYGTIRNKESDSRGTFMSEALALDFYFNKHLFIETTFGQEKSNYKDYGKIEQRFIGSSIGFNTSPSKTLDMTIQSGIKDYLNNGNVRGNTTYDIKIMFHIKF